MQVSRINDTLAKGWIILGPRFLPFADAATPELPLGRLLRLALFQVSVGMAIVLLIGTLNRVMIVELGVPAWLVALMVSLPLVFAPFRALVGFRSDTHRSVLGWRRVPYIWMGTLLQFGGLAIMPFALLVLSGDTHGPLIIGQIGAGLAFLLVGAGLHTTQTVGLALATDLAPTASQPRVVGLLYVMLLLGMVAGALIFGVALAHFSQIRLIQVIQGAALTTMVLNLLALWKQEARDPTRTAVRSHPSFQESWRMFNADGKATRRLVSVGLGTAAFSMEDILLEPYGGQILHLSVGTLAGLFAFSAVIFSAPLESAGLFAFGTALIGFGGGLFGHGTLTATMGLAPSQQTGLALGAWGAAQASAAGVAIALGGAIRDGVSILAEQGFLGTALNDPSIGYSVVYHIEIALLFATLVAIGPLVRTTSGSRQRSAPQLGLA
jgi:BCD family chlorophyll transporter-like MFS transporter